MPERRFAYVLPAIVMAIFVVVAWRSQVSEADRRETATTHMPRQAPQALSGTAASTRATATTTTMPTDTSGAPRKPIWERLDPAVRADVRERLSTTPAFEKVDLGDKGIMYRMSDRYRPVIVGIVEEDGSLTVGEIDTLPLARSASERTQAPPETRATDANEQP